MARPARLLMRCRNPCLRARFLLLGWNVRFISVSTLGIDAAKQASDDGVSLSPNAKRHKRMDKLPGQLDSFPPGAGVVTSSAHRSEAL